MEPTPGRGFAQAFYLCIVDLRAPFISVDRNQHYKVTRKALVHISLFIVKSHIKLRYYLGSPPLQMFINTSKTSQSKVVRTVNKHTE